MRAVTRQRIETVSQLLKARSLNAPLTNAACWGRWHFRASELTLRLVTPGNQPQPTDLYAVSLEMITTSSEMLHCILQVASKTWATPEIVHDLITALSAIFQPQRNLCPGGVGQRINARALLCERLKASTSNAIQPPPQAD